MKPSKYKTWFYELECYKTIGICNKCVGLMIIIGKMYSQTQEINILIRVPQ